MAVLTVHHWTDKRRGLAEVRRVTRGPVVMFTGFDRALNTSWWLHDYFPAVKRLVGGRIVAPERFADVLGPAEVIPVPIPCDCRDGFEAAYWQRPEAILDPAMWRASSALSMIRDADRTAGMARLSADLASGEWRRRYGHLLELDELDLGYRIAHDEAARRIEAAVAAGGRISYDAEAPAFWVLADPEGNEACICTWQGRDS